MLSRAWPPDGHRRAHDLVDRPQGVLVEPEAGGGDGLVDVREVAGPGDGHVDGWMLGVTAHAGGNYCTAVDLLGKAAHGLRDQGRLGLLAQALIVRGWGRG
jgi:hypothetical protein